MSKVLNCKYEVGQLQSLYSRLLNSFLERTLIYAKNCGLCSYLLNLAPKASKTRSNLKPDQSFVSCCVQASLQALQAEPLKTLLTHGIYCDHVSQQQLSTKSKYTKIKKNIISAVVFQKKLCLIFLLDLISCLVLTILTEIITFICLTLSSYE